MLLTDGPKPVSFDVNGQTYVIGTGILNGKNTLRVIAEIVKLDGKKAEDLSVWDVLATCEDVRYMQLHLELNATKNGQPVTKEEAKEIFDESNVILLQQRLVKASGYEEIKNSSLAENQAAPGKSSPTKSTTAA